MPLEREEPRHRSSGVPDFAVPSGLPVTTREPSGLNDADETTVVCPLRVRTSAPLPASQTFAVLS